MSRWINTDALIRYGKRGTLVYWEDIEEAPSIDIVRCKECKYWHNKLCAIWSQFRTIETEADDFCSYGEVSEKPTGSERSSE